MIMSIKMLGIVADAKKYIAFKKHFNEDWSDVFDKKKDFWELDEEEMKYLIQEVDKWDKEKGRVAERFKAHDC